MGYRTNGELMHLQYSLAAHLSSVAANGLEVHILRMCAGLIILSRIHSGLTSIGPPHELHHGFDTTRSRESGD